MNISIEDKIFDTFVKLGYRTSGIKHYIHDWTFEDALNDEENMFVNLGVFDTETRQVVISILCDILEVEQELFDNILTLYKHGGFEEDESPYEELDHAIKVHKRELKLKQILD